MYISKHILESKTTFRNTRSETYKINIFRKDESAMQKMKTREELGSKKKLLLNSNEVTNWENPKS